jgi:hypothetical protein
MGYQSPRAMIAHKQPHYVLKPIFLAAHWRIRPV